LIVDNIRSCPIAFATCNVPEEVFENALAMFGVEHFRVELNTSNAATGAPSVDAVTVKPAGAFATESPCDIHTLRAVGILLKIFESPDFTDKGVRPNSERPVFATSPPSAAAIAWNP
jgi:hypothetical protein